MPPERPIACVLDEFSYTSFSTAHPLLNLPADGWRPLLERSNPKLLLIESVFFGHGGQWHGLVAHAARQPDSPLHSLIAYCRESRVPVVFWNKDDPVRYSDFLDAARLADHVLTTDVTLVDRYRAETDARSVDVLPFATHLLDQTHAEPMAAKSRVCFPGSWYRRYPERGRELKMLLKASRPYGLDILDRNVNHPNRRQVAFPWTLRKHIVGSVPANEMPNVFRRYGLILNVNTVTTSPTMLSRRVMDVFGAGGCVLSNRSAGLDGLFGPGIVPTAGSRAEATRWIGELLGDSRHRRSIIERAQAVIRERHQVRHRIDKLLTYART